MDGLIAYALSKKYADEVGRSIVDAGFKTQVEQDRSILQTIGQEKILYFIPKMVAKPSDGYDEYVYSNNAWEQVGATDIDLNSYATKAEVGDLDNLPTTDKSSIVSAISETFTSVSNGKSLVASAITDKGVSTSSDATFSEMAQNIEAIPAGSPEPKTVNFYDFKGNLVHSYTAEEAEALTELPEAPTITGFTFQSWKHTLPQIKSWLTNHDFGELNTAGLYVTSNGHTKIHMCLRESHMVTHEMPFYIRQMAGTIIIDWGDGSELETITTAGNHPHLWQIEHYPADVTIDINYIPSGDTKLTLGRESGGLRPGVFDNDLYYASCVTAIDYGLNADIAAYTGTWKNCINLQQVNIPIDFTTMGEETFYNCLNLKFIAIPNTIKGSLSGAFDKCQNLKMISFPNEISDIGTKACRNCSNLLSITFPDSIVNIKDGAFTSCHNLNIINFPNSLTTIRNSSFSECLNIQKIKIPNTVTTIGSTAFANCTNLYVIDLSEFADLQSIPTLSNVNAFSNIPAQAILLVKNQEMYDAFTTATNWSSYASKFVIKEAT